MKQGFVFLVALMLLGMLAGAGPVLAAKAGVERFHLKRQNCHWTPEMGQFIYDCLKRGDGFGAHWCHNGAMDQFCPAEEFSGVNRAVGTPTPRDGDDPAVLAEGTNKLERFHLRRGNCQWTAEMGQYIYDCLKRGDGFGAHWCHNGAMDQFCPRQEPDNPAASPPVDNTKG